jgi:hypothetical protein
MRARILAVALGIGGMGLMASCDLGQTLNEAFNVFSVKFSEGSPAVDGQTITYSGAGLSLSNFKFKMVFHVRADNSANSNKAAFGSSLVKPVLDFRINDKTRTDPISTTIEPFSVAGGQVSTLDFPIEIPITLIDRATVRSIINGDPIPYFLSGTVKFDLLDGTTIKGSGNSALDLSSGSIPTRPSGSVTSLLSNLL